MSFDALCGGKLETVTPTKDFTGPPEKKEINFELKETF